MTRWGDGSRYDESVAEQDTHDKHVHATGTTFVWHEVYAPDAQKSIDFYTQALDFGTESHEMGEIGTYHMLTKNGTPVCGVLSTTEMKMDDVPPHWATYIAVDDVDARVAKCQSLGASVVVPAMDVPQVGRMCLISDPQGAYVWLFTPSSSGG